MKTDAFTSGAFESICFASSNIGYAAGLRGAIFKTTNAGLTWSALNSATQSDLMSIHFENSLIGYVVGSAGTSLSTVDGGITWKSMLGGCSDWLFSVFFTDENTGYAVGNTGAILKTNDGLLTSSSIAANKPSHFNLYPNPAHNEFYLDLHNPLTKNTLIAILDTKGQTLLKLTYHNPAPINISSLSPGFYLVRIQSSSGSETKKLMVY